MQWWSKKINDDVNISSHSTSRNQFGKACIAFQLSVNLEIVEIINILKPLNILNEFRCHILMKTVNMNFPFWTIEEMANGKQQIFAICWSNCRKTETRHNDFIRTTMFGRTKNTLYFEIKNVLGTTWLSNKKSSINILT